jgi:hypothetical protein
MIAYFALGGSVVSCQPLGSTPVLATVLAVEGEVTVRRGSADKESRKLTPESLISAGDEIRCGTDGVAALALAPNLYTQLGSDTAVIVEELRINKRGDAMVNAMRSRTARIRVVSGSIVGMVAKPLSGRASIGMKSRAGHLIVSRSGFFSVRATSDATRVAMIRGAGTWRPSDKPNESLVIRAGYFVEQRTGSPGEMRMEAVSDDIDAQADAVAAVSLERRLNELAAVLVKQPAPWKRSSPR